MTSYKKMAEDAAEFVRSRFTSQAHIGILTGTGLGDIAAAVTPEAVLSYSEIPHFQNSTVVSHSAKLLAGTIGNKPAVAMQGRLHLYEGYTPNEVAFPIRVMQELGINLVIITNAAGGINPTFQQGDIMIIADHINLTGQNPLLGPNEDSWGQRFPDMSGAYDSSLIDLSVSVAESSDIAIQKGIYAGLLGPSLETPAEIRFLNTIGADAVGLSTIMEVIAAAHAGMKILGLSAITNINRPDAPEKTSAKAVIETASIIAPKMTGIICKIIEKIN